MTLKTNIVLEKPYQSSLKLVPVIWEIQKNKKEFILTRQVIRSGTSIGANAEEAMGGSSRKDFRAKLDISYKEGRETKYWLKLMRDTQLLDEKTAEELITDCDELLKILYSIIKSSKN